MSGPDALEWATHLREVRASILAALGSGELAFRQLGGMRNDPAVAAIHVGSLIEAQPGVRKVDARRRLDASGISQRSPLGSLDLESLGLVESIAARVAAEDAP